MQNDIERLRIGREGEMHLLLGGDIDYLMRQGLPILGIPIKKKSAYTRESVLRCLVTDLTTRRKQLNEVLTLEYSMGLLPLMTAQLKALAKPPS
jgi:hypothetical protein